jgi:catechol 2,3-dioxygenase-like lactoylglutathione lyase family enzyme
MANAGELFQITPFLHVPDLARALDFFTRVLRFEVKFAHADYAYLEWGPLSIRLLEEPQRQLVPGDRLRLTIYIDVRDVDALYAELLPGLQTLPAGDVHGPMDEPWHQRELHVRLPDGQWLAFGMPTPAQGSG